MLWTHHLGIKESSLEGLSLCFLFVRASLGSFLCVSKLDRRKCLPFQESLARWIKKTISSQDSSINSGILSQTKDSKMIKDLQTHLAEELRSIKDSLNTKKIKQQKTTETKHEKKDSDSHNFSEEFTKISEEIKRPQIGFAEIVERETKLILQKTNSRFCEIEKI